MCSGITRTSEEEQTMGGVKNSKLVHHLGVACICAAEARFVVRIYIVRCTRCFDTICIAFLIWKKYDCYYSVWFIFTSPLEHIPPCPVSRYTILNNFAATV